MSLQTITQILQTVNNQSSNPFQSMTLDDFSRKSKFSVDPLVCSVMFHRRNNTYGLSDFSKEHILPEDYALADTIRTYYLKKYFWDALKNNRPQSEYRASVVRLLNIKENWDLTERESGLFVKLPCFYAEDQVYENLKKTVKTDKDTYFRKGSAASVTVRLEFLAKTFRWQRVKRISYWFKDQEDKLYSYTTMDGHPFNLIFEEVIQTPRTFEFSHGIDNIVDMWYNNMKSFTILKDQNA